MGAVRIYVAVGLLVLASVLFVGVSATEGVLTRMACNGTATIMTLVGQAPSPAEMRQAGC